jgi:hypothetical protein
MTVTFSQEALQSLKFVVHWVLHPSSLHFFVQSFLTLSHFTEQSCPTMLSLPHAAASEAPRNAATIVPIATRRFFMIGPLRCDPVATHSQLECHRVPATSMPSKMALRPEPEQGASVVRARHVLHSFACQRQGSVLSSNDCTIAQGVRRAKPRAQVRVVPFRHVRADVYANRAGRNLSPSRKHILQQAKAELRALFDREAWR